MSHSNAGIHASINHFRYQYGGKGREVNFYDLLFKNKSEIPSITAVGDVNMLGWIVNVVAEVQDIAVVGRIVANEGIKLTWGQGNAKAKAIAWADKMDSDLSKSPNDLITRYIYWQPIDETKLHYDWHTEFDLAAMDRMIQHGRRYAALNEYTGAPEQTPYDVVDGLGRLWPIFERSAALWPHVIIQTHAYVQTDQPLDYEHQKYHVLRPISWIERARAKGLNLHMVIGETGTYEPYKYSGLKNYEELVKTMRWVWDQYQPYPEVISLNTYTCDTLGDGAEDWFTPLELITAQREYNIKNAGVDIPPIPQSPAPPADGVPYRATITSPIGLNARLGLSDGGAFLKTLPLGTEVTVLDESGPRAVIQVSVSKGFFKRLS